MKNNKKFFLVDGCKLSFTVEGAHYDFQNLFNGDKTLAEPILKVINDNSLEIFKDVQAGVEASYALVVESLAKHIFNKIPIDEIFLD